MASMTQPAITIHQPKKTPFDLFFVETKNFRIVGVAQLRENDYVYAITNGYRVYNCGRLMGLISN
jgi:hypothetical protein